MVVARVGAYSSPMWLPLLLLPLLLLLLLLLVASEERKEGEGGVRAVVSILSRFYLRLPPSKCSGKAGECFELLIVLLGG